MNDAGTSPEEQATEIALLGQKMDTLGKGIDALTALVTRWREEDRETHQDFERRMREVEGISGRRAERWRAHEREHNELNVRARIYDFGTGLIAAAIGIFGGQQ